MKKKHAWALFTGSETLGQEELAVNFHAVSGLENDLLRGDKSFGGKFRGPRLGSERLGHGFEVDKTANEWASFVLRVGSKLCNVISCCNRDWAPFDSLPASQCARRIARDVHTPNVAAVDVTAIRIEENGFFIDA